MEFDPETDYNYNFEFNPTAEVFEKIKIKRQADRALRVGLRRASRAEPWTPGKKDGSKAHEMLTVNLGDGARITLYGNKPPTAEEEFQMKKHIYKEFLESVLEMPLTDDKLRSVFNSGQFDELLHNFDSEMILSLIHI